MKKSLIWFRQDLRIFDNPTLDCAFQNNQQIIPIFILDEEQDFKIGSASKWFLHQALESLKNDLKKFYNIDLLFFKGNSQQILQDLIKKYEIDSVFYNRVYEPNFIKRDIKIKADLEQKNIEVKSFNSSLLFEINSIKNTSKSFFRVFTPFARTCLNNNEKITKIIAKPKNLRQFKIEETQTLDSLNLLSKKPNWATDWKNYWQVSEENAHNILDEFVQTTTYQPKVDNNSQNAPSRHKISQYDENRNFPAILGTTKLSAFIHYGLISVKVIFHKISFLLFSSDVGAKQFMNQILWREFSYNLLYNFPNLDKENYVTKFNNFPWQNNKTDLKRWQSGQTGYPLIDAGMRQLYQTGWMHNRVRMVVASFLTKNLLIDWRLGLKWFDDCLIDANLANNAASWQWVAGCGFDAAPYFRIFNPILQSKRFDKDGNYIRKWVPELKDLNNKDIHEPFNLSEEKLKAAKIVIGKTYPKPMIGLNYSRDVALMAYKNL